MDHEDAARAFCTWMQEKRGAQPGTLEKYRRLTLDWATWADTPLADRTPEDVEAWSTVGRNGQRLAPATVVNRQLVLSSLYGWGQERLGWGRNPTALAGRPRVHNVEPNPVDDATWLRWWTCELTDQQRVATGLPFYCGLRREETVELTRGQVWNGALVNFTRKNGGKDRLDYTDMLDHWAATMPWLEPMRLAGPLRAMARGGGDTPLVFRTHVRPERLNKVYVQWLRQGGLPSDLFKPHRLRASCATNLARPESGIRLEVIAALLNHANIQTTMRYVDAAGGTLAAERRLAVAR